MKFWFNRFKPVSWQGWLSYIIAIAVLVWDFRAIYRTSGSTSDIIFNFFPHVAGIFLLFAVIIRAKGTINRQ